MVSSKPILTLYLDQELIDALQADADALGISRNRYAMLCLQRRPPVAELGKLTLHELAGQAVAPAPAIPTKAAARPRAQQAGKASRGANSTPFYVTALAPGQVRGALLVFGPLSGAAHGLQLIEHFAAELAKRYPGHTIEAKRTNPRGDGELNELARAAGLL